MLNTELPCDPEITRLYISTHPREVKTYAPIKTSTQTLIAALLIIAKERSHPNAHRPGGPTEKTGSPQTGHVRP